MDRDDLVERVGTGEEKDIREEFGFETTITPSPLLGKSQHKQQADIPMTRYHCPAW
jgi:hypothetical protein